VRIAMVDLSLLLERLMASRDLGGTGSS